MLSLNQLSRRIEDLSKGRLSVGDFLDWFRVSSRDFHIWGDDELQRAVFSVESVLSEYHFAGLDGSELKQELATAICPFGLPTTHRADELGRGS